MPTYPYGLLYCEPCRLCSTNNAKKRERFMSFNIGKYRLEYGLMLAPMAGVTDTTFRLLCKSLGAEYTVSEMVCAKAMCYEQKAKKIKAEQSATACLARVLNAELPMAVQLFGSEPEFMAEAARMIENSSYAGCRSECAPSAIDINMGCPVRKITSNGEGSALMKDTALAAKIVEAVAKAVSLPVTVKIRAGWDSGSVNAPEFAKAMQDAGASLICVHARTKEQLYTPGIDLSVIEKTKKAVSIPVVGNGDIYTAEDAVKMLDATGCDGIMIGRGAEGNPWIFSEIRARLRGEEYLPPSLCERLSTATAQLDDMVARKGERIGVAEAKKHIAWYVTGIRDAASARSSIMKAETSEQIKEILKIIARNEGEDLCKEQ